MGMNTRVQLHTLTHHLTSAPILHHFFFSSGNLERFKSKDTNNLFFDISFLNFSSHLDYLFSITRALSYECWGAISPGSQSRKPFAEFVWDKFPIELPCRIIAVPRSGLSNFADSKFVESVET